MPRLRRFVCLLAFAAWQGGFVFYAGVVVPVGTELHGHFGQGLVTQRVTNAINLLGLACHAASLWELLAVPGRKRFKWALWAGSLGVLGGLAAVHLKMDSLIDPVAGCTPPEFRGWHILYLWLSTAQWAAWMALAWLILRVNPGRVQFRRPPVH